VASKKRNGTAKYAQTRPKKYAKNKRGKENGGSLVLRGVRPLVFFLGRVRTGSKSKVRLETCADAAAM